MTDRELLQMALDALCMAVEPKKGKVYAFEFQPIDCEAMHIKAIEALRARLAQPEPVIQARKEGDLIVVDLPQVPRGSGGISKREWVGLTDEELEFYTEELGQGELGRGVLRAVVDFLKDKNT